MQRFDYIRPEEVGVLPSLSRSAFEGEDALQAAGQFLGGGTTMVDLMKLYVMRPQLLVDIKRLRGLDTIETTEKGGLRLGALVTMNQAAHDQRLHDGYRIVVRSLDQAASQQVRNMARLGGNVLQRTRCSYFRDPSFEECNKRTPGSGCAARNGVNEKHALLGTTQACIATYPGDFAQSLMALDATVSTNGPFNGRPFAELHRHGETPEIETRLAPGELITSFLLPPVAEWTRRSVYVKIRDRDSYAFALASAAVGLAVENGKVAEVRIALGGLATVPWRAHAAEATLRGQTLNEETATAAAETEFAAAERRAQSNYRISLGKATMVRALLDAQPMEIERCPQCKRMLQLRRCLSVPAGGL